MGDPLLRENRRMEDDEQKHRDINALYEMGPLAALAALDQVSCRSTRRRRDGRLESFAASDYELAHRIAEKFAREYDAGAIADGAIGKFKKAYGTDRPENPEAMFTTRDCPEIG